ncbi:hypothetical protein HBI56_161650 [Parastagonospora nodorum]|nr:hypothetical protein HBH56_210990 [Parastagonospora nodorum]QRD05974.1 hypothetical protein JI435_133950 [Parastagonospora nodorum SN15]KAH3931313.1 hypothetical protein HBH54_099600 [Parastagonospora nodorum]KAH3944288.1 hypothetical protein HBH53_161050 [Parastagonospora nodorum]KAH3960677.1 hypothetical protein HBH51_189350 [Parastagonospora nodorum]
MNRAAGHFRTSEKKIVATVEGAGDGVDDQREREEDGEVSGLVQGCSPSDETQHTGKLATRFLDLMTGSRHADLDLAGQQGSQSVGNSPDSLQPQATPQPLRQGLARSSGHPGSFWLSETDTYRVGGQGADLRLRLLFLRPTWATAHKAEGDDCTR